MIRYAITDIGRSLAQPAARRDALLSATRRWAAMGLDYIQLREKFLDAGELYALAAAMKSALIHSHAKTRLLVNSRADIAVAAACDGVHLTSAPGELTPLQVDTLFANSGLPKPVISVSCHSPQEAVQARLSGADIGLFGPVFEKSVGTERVSAGTGLAQLTRAVQAADGLPVLALGGITAANASDCMAAGAAGVAAIRLFA